MSLACRVRHRIASRRSVIAAALCCGVTLAGALGRTQAAELVVRDLHADLEVLPNAFDYKLTGGSADHSGSDAFDSHYGLAIGGDYSFAGPGDTHGFMAGLELTVEQASYASIGHLTSYGLRATGGYGYAFSDAWTAMARVGAGYGLATFDITSNSALPAISQSGSYFSYGATAVLLYTINDAILIDAKLGYQKASNKLSGGGIDMTLDNAGLLFGLGITYRLSTSPRSLE
jgi:hypothetical protein